MFVELLNVANGLDLHFIGVGLLGIRRPTLSQVRSVASTVVSVATLPITVSAKVTNAIAAEVLPQQLAAAVRNVTAIGSVPANALVRGSMPTRVEALQVGRGILTVAAVAGGVAAYGAYAGSAGATASTATGGAAATSGAAAVSPLASTIGSGIVTGVGTAAKAVGTVVAAKSLVNGAPQPSAQPTPVYAPQPEASGQSSGASGLNTSLLLAGAVLALKLLL